MAERLSGAGQGRRAIGRQIVLPFSKAFEIAWKGIRIRIWRSLITMSGIVLAIAFLMSVWADGVFYRALRRVPEDHRLHAIVQGALEAEAIGGGVRVRCALLADAEEPQAREVAPEEALYGFLTRQDGFTVERTVPTPGMVGELFAGGETPVDALITEGLPQALRDTGVVAALKQFIERGGLLIVVGTRGLDDGASAGVLDILPGRPEAGTFSAQGSTIVRAQRAMQLPWQAHPLAEFRRVVPRADATVLATAQGQPVALSRPLGAGSVVWYPVEAASGADRNVLSWFTEGRAAGVAGPTARAASPLIRLVARGLGAAGRERDMKGVWLVTLSLMVCVVGITNAMLMSVTERFREIGTMKCLGALDKFIVKLFLIESTLQGLAGSLVGAAIGFMLAFVRVLFTYHVQDLETGDSYWLAVRFLPVLDLLAWVAIAVGVGMVLSVVAAIYPAIRAARMEPVQAMRVEA